MVKREKIGKILVGMGFLREEQVAEIVENQKNDRGVELFSRFGEVCVRKGWVSASNVTAALKDQKKMEYDRIKCGDILLSLGFLSPGDYKRASAISAESGDEIEEVLIENRFSTPLQIKAADEKLFLRRSASLRSQTSSSFAPYDIMPLLVLKQIDQAMDIEGQCRCSQCWNNIFSLALNNLPSLYVSENRNIDKYLARFDAEYHTEITEKLDAAIGKVHLNPKASCRSKFSDDLLSGIEDEASAFDVTVNVSNRHIHLSKEDLEGLFGKGHELVSLKDLMQTGQYAAAETVVLCGPKGEIPKVRVLGPVRGKTQVEISGTDQFVLGIKAPVRASGKLDGTPGITIRGPAGEINLKEGLVRALRHIHMSRQDADRMGIHSGEMVNVRLVGDRSTICEGVLIRADDKSVLEMHIDTDEANAAGLASRSEGKILVSRVSG